MDLGRLAGEARRRGLQAVELLKEAAFELSWDARDAARTGFGVPKLVSSAASLGVATVAAAGAASVAFDFTGKIWGKKVDDNAVLSDLVMLDLVLSLSFNDKECVTCNGWEGLRCDVCMGSGNLQYRINESSLTEADRASSQSIAQAALDGRAEFEYIPAAVKLDFPFPYADCPRCDGTGVMTCTTCKGNAWVPRFTIARTMNAPWLAWDAYRKMDQQLQPSGGVIEDPETAAFEMFGKEELESGVPYDEDVKQAVMSKYEDAREYDIIRAKVARREQGWETLQEMLFIKDPVRAARDPAIVSDPLFYKAKMKVWDEVSKLPVPPRPTDWLKVQKPLKESDWTKEDLKDPRKRSEMDVLLEGQEKFFNSILDNSWETHWREQKFEEVKKEMIDSYELGKDRQQPVEPESKQRDVVGPRPPSVSSSKQTRKPVEKAADVKRRPEDEKKRRERQERSERMARQAAEREAALAKAKAAREQRPGR